MRFSTPATLQKHFWGFKKYRGPAPSPNQLNQNGMGVDISIIIINSNKFFWAAKIKNIDAEHRFALLDATVPGSMWLLGT